MFCKKIKIRTLKNSAISDALETVYDASLRGYYIEDVTILLNCPIADFSYCTTVAKLILICLWAGSCVF